MGFVTNDERVFERPEDSSELRQESELEVGNS